MGKSLLDRIQAKLELFRLEKRYTRRRHRRSTFVSNAVYVDGEYVYQTPSSTGSSDDSSGINALHGERAAVAAPPVIPGPLPEPVEEVLSPIEQRATESRDRERERKRMHRFSSIPHFGGSYSPYSQNTGMPSIQARRSSMIQ